MASPSPLFLRHRQENMLHTVVFLINHINAILHAHPQLVSEANSVADNFDVLGAEYTHFSQSFY